MTRLQLTTAGVSIEGAWLVRGVTLGLEAGRLTTLVGLNGSGKSTILRLLAGLWRPAEGEVLLDGQQLHVFSRREIAKQVTFVAQDERLDFAFTVQDVVAMGRHPHLGRFGREGPEDRQAIQDALQCADVAHLAGRFANELSGGEKKRVLLARSLATQADVILLDEPTSNLDVEHALEILDLCRGLSEAGKTIAMAIHDLNAVCRFSDRVAVVHHGRLHAVDEPSRLLTSETIEKIFGVEAERARTPGGESVFLFNRRGAATNSHHEEASTG